MELILNSESRFFVRNNARVRIGRTMLADMRSASSIPVAILNGRRQAKA
jgi:hypothetical protein